MRRSWAEFDRRADGIARTLLDAGVDHQDKVAQYLYNCPEYLESMFAAFKAGLVPVNTNYRYVDDELIYLWDNADAVAVVFHGTFADRIDDDPRRVSGCSTWLWVDDGSGPVPRRGPRRSRTAAAAAAERVVAALGPRRRRPDFLYTGGTTGMPKGVMWRQDDLIRATVGATNPSIRDDEADLAIVDRAVNGPGHVADPGLPADARHRPVHLAHRPVRRRVGGHRWRAARSTSTSCSTPSSARR